MKVLKGTPKHLSKTGELGSFTYLMENLRFKCNYRCPKCFNLENDEPITQGEHITLRDRLNLVEDAASMGGKVVVISGEGEPSIDKDIKQLVSGIKGSGLIPIIYSNGNLLSKEWIEFYKSNDAVLVFAFDSLDTKNYDLLTGTEGRMEVAKENISKAIELYRDKVVTSGDMRVLNVAVNTTLSSINKNELGEIKEYFGDDAYFICNPLARSGNAVGNWKRMIMEDDTSWMEETIKNVSESGGPLTLGSDGLCGYSWWGIGVSPTGDYMTCAYTHDSDGLLGNIRDTRIEEAFETKKRIESDHYKMHGITPCLVRSERYQMYIDGLKKHKKQSL